MARIKKLTTNIEPKLEPKEVPISEPKEEPKLELQIQSNENILPVITKSKRGRKPKNASLLNNLTKNTNENIILYHSDDIPNNCCDEEKQIILEIKDTNIIENIDNSNDEKDVLTKPAGKKRGRKPKGGKIIQQILPLANIKESKPNVILHLKCSLKDLQNNVFENNINGFLANNTSEWYYYFKLLFDNQKLMQKLGSNGIKKVEQKYSVQYSAPILCNNFNNLILF